MTDHDPLAAITALLNDAPSECMSGGCDPACVPPCHLIDADALRAAIAETRAGLGEVSDLRTELATLRDEWERSTRGPEESDDWYGRKLRALLERHPESTADRDELAEVLSSHGYTFTEGVGGTCPACDHVYFPNRRGGYIDPDLDWLRGAVEEHRADAVINAGWRKS